MPRKILKNSPKKKDRKRIVKVLSELGFNPYNGNIEKIEGEKSSWRRRVGNYRIFYDIYKGIKIISVTNIERRTSSTY